MSYTDLRDFTEEFSTVTPEGLSVRLEKLGGGTVGRAYVGTWRYIVSDPAGVELGRGQDFTSGMPHTHAETALAVAEFFAPED